LIQCLYWIAKQLFKDVLIMQRRIHFENIFK
jgi:hypothetical protein